MEQKEENVTEEHPEKKPFVIPADDCTIVFDDLPEAVQKQLDDTPPNIADWKCCTHCGDHEEGIKFITCPHCLDCQLGPTYYCTIGCQITAWPIHKRYCMDPARDEKMWERRKILRGWESVARPIIIWAMKQAFYFNPDFDPSKSLFRIFVQGDATTEGPSRLYPTAVFLAPREPLCASWSDDSSERWWYCLDFHQGPEGGGAFGHLIFPAIIKSDWKKSIVFTDGAFEDWSYIFFHTCLKRSFTKSSLYTRANLFISAARIARDMEPKYFRPPMTDSHWEETTTNAEDKIKMLPFGRRKIWMMMIQVMHVWDIMVETGAMKQVLEGSSELLDSKPCFPVVPDHFRLVNLKKKQKEAEGPTE